MPHQLHSDTIESRRTPFVFLVGCPRSGTTLLQRMIDAHPLLAVANDTHFIPRAIESLAPEAFVGRADPKAVPLTPQLVEWVRSYRRFPRLGVDDTAVDRAATNATTYVDFVSNLYTAFAEKHGKSLGGEKTPDYVRFLPLLHALFPWVKSVHIVRDGRDVALSALQWATKTKGPGKLALWDEHPVGVCALWWHRQVQSGRRDAPTLKKGTYHEIRYEQLIYQTEQVLRSITDFLGLPFESSMLEFNKGKVNPKPGLSAKKAWLAPTAGLRDWRTEMDDQSVELFEALAGDLLNELGYDRRFERISDHVVQTADYCRGWWQAHFGDDHGQTPVQANRQNIEPQSLAGG